MAGALLFLTWPVPVCRSAEGDPILPKAGQLLRTGNGTGAKSVYKEYLKLHPGSVEAQVGLAAIAEREFRFAEARRILDSALGGHPDNPRETSRILVALARLFHRWTVLSRDMGIVADNPSVDYHARAEESLQQARMLNPDGPAVLTAWAEWQMDFGDRVTAELGLEKALRKDPAFIPAYQGLTRFYLRNKDLAGAKSTILHALELDPDNCLSHFQMAQMLALAEHPGESAKYALQSQQLDFGRMPERDLLLAQNYEKLGDLPQAVHYYETIVRDYAPRHAPTLQKLAELNEALNRHAKTADYYRQALAVDTDLLRRMVKEARDNLREEKTMEALPHWRRLLAIKPLSEADRDAALHALASAHFADYFYKRTNPTEIRQDLERFDNVAPSSLTPLLEMDRLKLEIALAGGIDPALREKLSRIATLNDNLAAGEAMFLLEDYIKALEALDAVEGNEARDYLAAADRLLLVQELVASEALYQRGLSMEPLPELKRGLERIKAKRALAEKYIDAGNQLYAAKNYAGAAAEYDKARQIYRQWETPHLRLGDTYEKLHKPALAYEAYHRAVVLSPALLDSKGFSKKYGKLKKLATK